MFHYRYILSILSTFCIFSNSQIAAQEIDFGSFSSMYSVTISEFSPGEDLDFGWLIQNEGSKYIDLNNSKVIVIEAVEYLDIIVDITADDYMLQNGDLGCISDPSCRIPYTLQVAYANRGTNNTANAIVMNVTSNVASAQFPVKYRGNAPPGPPPTPVYSGYNPAIYNESAYLYIYGSINVGAINSGSYFGQITIQVSYD